MDSMLFLALKLSREREADMDIADLITRLEKSEGPSRELDAEIGVLFDIRPDWLKQSQGEMWLDKENRTIRWRDARIKKSVGNVPAWDLYDWSESKVPSFTGSVDAAIALCERVLPRWTICFEVTDGIAKDVYLIGPEYRDDRPEQNASPPIGGKPTAIALCIAILIAVQRVKEQQP